MRCVSTPLDTNGFGYASFRGMGHRARTAHIRALVAAPKDTAIPIDKDALVPERLTREHRALIRATAARVLHVARIEKGTDAKSV